MAHVLHDVQYRKDTRATHTIVIRWRPNLPRKRDEPWYLMTNLEGRAESLCQLYGCRMQVEHAFRVLRSELLLRPVWHHYSGRTQAHVMVCVLAYALRRTLDHLAKRAALETEIHEPDSRHARAAPKPRPMTPEVILRELGQIDIGDILLETTDDQQLALRRVARPMAE
jgi:transposase